LSAHHRRAEAISLVNRYKLAHRLDQDFYIQIGTGYELGRDFGEATKIMQEGLKSRPTSFDLLFTEARIWLDVGEADRAEADLKLCATLKPNSGQVKGQMARVLTNRGELNRALAESTQAVKMEPGSAVLLAIHSGILANLGRYKEACEAQDKAISIVGTSSAAVAGYRRDRAPLREKLGQYQGAIDDYVAFLKSDDYRNPRNLTKVGECYLKLRQPQKALPYFELALRRDANILDAHRGKLAALEALHQTEAAASEKKLLRDTEADFTPPR
jgi:tetratricopeptide (TPR) repeat protein